MCRPGIRISPKRPSAEASSEVPHPVCRREEEAVFDLPVLFVPGRITSYNVCYTKLLRDDCTLSAEFEVTPESANQTYVEVEAKDKGAISYQWIAKSKDEQTDIVLGTEESLIISDISNLHTEGIVLPCVECEPSAFFYLPLTLIVDNGLCIRSMMKDIDVNNIPLISVGTKDAQQIKVACYPNPNPGEITISGLRNNFV